MLRALTAVFLILLFFTACTQRTVCPAFQSAFIYDKDELRKKFTYIKEDSTPKIYSASKTKYLIAEPTTYRKKMRQIQTVAARPVYVTLPDSFKVKDEGLLGEELAAGEDGVVPGAELDLAARSVIDSIYIEDVPRPEQATAEDSIYVISKDKEVRVLKYNFPDSLVYDEATGRYVAEKPRYAVVHVTFNVEQDNYMWYLRDYLVLPDVRQSRILQMARAEEQRGQKSGKKKKEGGFFKRLFGKKKAEPVEETPVQRAGDEEDFDFIDENEDRNNTAVPEQQPKEKKGLFRKRNKEPKVRKEDRQPQQNRPQEEPEPQEQKQRPVEKQILPEEAEVEGF